MLGRFTWLCSAAKSLLDSPRKASPKLTLEISWEVVSKALHALPRIAFTSASEQYRGFPSRNPLMNCDCEVKHSEVNEPEKNFASKRCTSFVSDVMFVHVRGIGSSDMPGTDAWTGLRAVNGVKPVWPRNEKRLFGDGSVEKLPPDALSNELPDRLRLVMLPRLCPVPRLMFPRLLRLAARYLSDGGSEVNDATGRRGESRCGEASPKRLFSTRTCGLDGW
jgi:hypothetical protein